MELGPRPLPLGATRLRLDAVPRARRRCAGRIAMSLPIYAVTRQLHGTTGRQQHRTTLGPPRPV